MSVEEYVLSSSADGGHNRKQVHRFGGDFGDVVSRKVTWDNHKTGSLIAKTQLQTLFNASTIHCQDIHQKKKGL